jgi:hypothetical protein
MDGVSVGNAEGNIEVSKEVMSKFSFLSSRREIHCGARGAPGRLEN